MHKSTSFSEKVKESWLTGCAANDRNIPRFPSKSNWLIFLLSGRDLARNPSNRFESRLIETSKKIIRFRFSLSHFPVKPPIDCDWIDASLRTQNTIPAGLLFRARAREKKRKFPEWLRAEKVGNKFLNAQLATTFCYCSFYFLPSLLMPRESSWKCARLALHQHTRPLGGEGKKTKSKAVLCAWRGMLGSIVASTGGRKGEMNNELRNGSVLN
jgi:hypothetical protein